MVVRPSKMWACDLCGKVFQRYINLQGHRRLHSHVCQYHCTVKNCAKAFFTLSQYQAHRRSHIDKRIYQCNACHSRFLKKRHHLDHTCSVHRSRHSCRLCGESFVRILSLAHHVKSQHIDRHSSSSRRITTVIKLKDRARSSKFKEVKKGRGDSEGSDKDKILLKIQAGKSMTIISPVKPSRSEKKSKCRKKSKKKRRKEEKESRKNGIILSIKNGSVKLPCENIPEKKKPKCQVVENVKEMGILKLKIKSYPESPQVERSTSSQKKRSKKMLSNDTLNSEETGRKKNNESDLLHSQRRSELDKGNKIVIQKDKSGKLLAKPMSKAKVRRKDRDNVFDAFSAGTWKVMPSPRTDSPMDGLKLKLSPHKPVRLDSGLDCSMESAKCLDTILKSRVDVSDESDVFDGLPVGDKLESPANTVNDSGIEVLSSSSYNRSNENSVRSVVMDENSPSYINMIEDSLLSVDSPESVKSTQMICPRCGGIVQEANNNTRSPGKCRCGDTSNPNSPFQTPVSPVKMNIHSSDMYRPHEHLLDSESQKNKAPIATSPCLSFNEMPSNTLTCLKTKLDPVKKCPSTKVEDEPDVMIVSKENASKDVSKLKLKLKTKKMGMSPNHTDWNDTIVENSGLAPTALSDKIEYSSKSQDLSVYNLESTITPSTVEPVKSEQTPKLANDAFRKVTETKTMPKSEEKLVDQVEHQTVARRKPLFKSKRSVDLSPTIPTVPDVSKKSEKVEIKKQLSCDGVVVSHSKEGNKKPLFKRRNSVDTSPEVLVNKKPIFKKRDLSLKRSFTGPASEKSHQNLKDDKKLSCVSEPVKSRANDKITESSKEIEKEKEHSNIFSSFGSIDSKDIPKVPVPEKQSKSSDKSSKVSESKASTCSSVKKDKSSGAAGDSHDSKAKSQEKHSGKKDKGKVSEKSNSNTQESKKKHTADKPRSKPKTKAVESKEVKAKGVATLGPGEDDSLPPLPDIDKEPCPASPKPVSKTNTSSLDLFQQQFLSFLSGNKTVPKVDDTDSKEKVRKSETEVKKSDERKSLPNAKQKDKGNNGGNNSIVAAFSDDDDFDLTEPKRLSASDSFSWLKIFSDKPDNNANSKVDNADTKTDVDFKEDLALINRKMDTVEDEDTSSLDVDDVFESQNLSSLQPKDVSLVDSFSGKISSAKSSKRPQVAKCSSGRLKKLKSQSKQKCKTKAIHMDDCSDSGSDHLKSCLNKHQSDSDPDFNPFQDSDDDFMQTKPSKKRDRSSRSSKGRQSCERIFGEIESNVNERSKRTKQGRKSCCPCCLGSPRKSQTQEHEYDIDSAKHPYRLPRRHKTFVRSSLHLLQLQEKIHTLFLTLFPECADIITKSRVGTDEFETLIDDVLYGLEGERCEFSPSVFSPSDTLTPQPFDKSQDTMCHNDQSGLVYPTTQGLLQLSNSVAAPIDLQSIERDSHMSSSSLPHSSQSINSESDLQKHGPNSCFRDTESMQWLNASLGSSASSASKYACVEHSNSGHACRRHLHSLSGSYDDINAHSAGLPVNSGGHCSQGSPGVLSQGLPLSPCPGSLQAPESELPSELVITIDLDAARVSLCKEPKDCLQRLHHRMVRLARCCLPKLNVNKNFYKNLDNVEFLIDMMIKANEGVSMDDLETSEDEEESASINCTKRKTSRSRSCTPQNSEKVRSSNTLNSGDFLVDSKKEVEPVFNGKTEEGNKLINVEKCLLLDPFDKINDNTHPVSKLNKVEERAPVLSKYQEQFELEIKSKRESLRKDVFDSEDEDVETVYKSPEEVLSSIQSLNKKISRRRGRDSRLRKRSADEKRTLFVQEKIMNNQNSTIIYSTDKFTNRDLKTKAARRNRSRSSSKKQFLSELNLGDKAADSPADSLAEEGTSVDSPSVSKGLDCSAVIKEEPESVEEEEEDEARRERHTSADKNIFELMQPTAETTGQEPCS